MFRIIMIIFILFVSCENSNETISGCTDETACNYNIDATVNDGSCEFSDLNEDCNGDCNVEVDCYGECGGTAEEDYCGQCGGSCIEGLPDSCNQMDCSGACFGNLEFDECGICGGDGTSCSEQDIFYLGSFTDSTLEVLYESTFDIGGFQFGVSGVDLISASGGDAESSGFTVTVGSILLGFAFDGSVIPSGSGILTNLDISIQDTASEACIYDLIVSDGIGQQMGVQTGGCITVP
jgi:hypothetical protein